MDCDILDGYATWGDTNAAALYRATARLRHFQPYNGEMSISETCKG
jgi:hypothetical protein